mmetsp:Transcript_12642/g.46201  ORF Transcript_12642/g.46201 Transcript_12642/m.46201 type:complete len:614 (+) Transcript_12642:277-2118(+)
MEASRGRRDRSGVSSGDIDIRISQTSLDFQHRHSSNSAEDGIREEPLRRRGQWMQSLRRMMLPLQGRGGFRRMPSSLTVAVVLACLTTCWYIQASESTLMQVLPEYASTTGLAARFRSSSAAGGTGSKLMQAYPDIYNTHDEVDGARLGGADAARALAVQRAFEHAWYGYRKYAWGWDELEPLSRTGHTWFGLGLTLVDSLDTMLLMGLKDHFEEATRWVRHNMTVAVNNEVNTFETTIRVLGGLLSAYQLSGERIFLQRAEQLADGLLPAFNTPTGIPLSDVNLATGYARGPTWAQQESSVSEASTLWLEFGTVTHLTNRTEFSAAAERALLAVANKRDSNGLLRGLFINPFSGALRSGAITLGARVDSYYEYLLKAHLIGGMRDDKYGVLYNQAMNGVIKKLLGHSRPSGLKFIGESKGGKFVAKMDHLVCFLPGLLALGYLHGMNDTHLSYAEELMQGCYALYRTRSGLAPEIAFFNDGSETARELGGGEEGEFHNHDVLVKPSDAHNLLRPEVVESLFVLYRVTRDPKYQEWGWTIFGAFERHCKVAGGGYAALDNVLVASPKKRNKMDSFFTAETLKYLYLLFSDSRLLPLDRWVFNTEAHPLQVFDY